MNQEFSEKCIDIIKKHIPDGCVVQSERDLVRRKDGSDYTDVDFYYYKDFISPDIASRVIFVFEFVRLSKDWVELKPDKLVRGTPSAILADYENGQLRFNSNNNENMPFDNESSYTECKFYKKNFKTKEFELDGDYVNEDIRKVVASSLKLLTDTISEINCPSISLTVIPIVVTEQKIKAELPAFNYTLGDDVKDLPFLDGVSRKDLEPVTVHILNVSELAITLPALNMIFKSTEMWHYAGTDVMRMLLDPLVKEMKQNDKNYRDI
ncbi:MAG: hypothetical protein PHU34_06190 [Candidatus Methanoperedens sp.]|nr:hypothetical protein [Candidatus Methanoperedens sp.]